MDMRQELVQLCGGAHALAIQILGNREDAADAVHDAFTTALSRPDSYDARKGPLKPWFMRVVRNRCLDLLRGRRQHTVGVDEVAHPGRGPEQAAEDTQRSRAIEQALASISSEKRQIVVLRDYLDLGYAEIADILAIAPGTVMSRLHRARLALKEAIESYDR